MRLLYFFLFCAFSLLAEEGIVVHLASEQQPASIVLKPIKGTGFEQKYLTDLEKIIQFDLNHNGRSFTVAATHFGTLLDRESWQIEGIDYVAEFTLVEGNLGVKVLDTKSGKIQRIADVKLTGTLAQDRRKIHEITDSIHLALFGKPSIASLRVLYTVRTRKADSSISWVSDVWECDYDGANAKQITFDGHLCVTPAYLPPLANERARNFVFVSYKIGQPKIYLSNVDNGELKRLSFLRGNQLMPTFSPQRDLIAFISDISGNPDLFIQDFSVEKGLLGKPKQIFSAPTAVQGSPTFSPDGKRLAFVSNKDGTPRIYVTPIPGRAEGDVKLISKKNRNNTSPSWSPDGNKLAYCSMTGSVRQIWIYDFAKDEEIQLTEGSSHKENPTFAPNSLHLLFNTEMNDNAELYLINLNQKQAVKISSGMGEKRFPAWEPLRINK